MKVPKRELYEAANAYRASALWEKRSQVGLFAVEYPGGETGYCVSTGGDAPCTLSVYMGEAQLDTLATEKKKKDGERTSGVECLMCSFSGADALMDMEKQAADEIGISLEGEIPRFRRHAKRRLPWPVADAKEEEYLRGALMAAAFLASLAENGNIPAYGTEDIIAIRWDGASFTQGTIRRPILKGDAYERAPLLDEIELARLRRLEINKGAKVTCDILISDKPQEGTPPHFPAVLLLMNESGVLEEIRHSGEDGSLDELVFALVDYLLANGKPDMMIASSRKTKAYFEKVCEQISLPLVLSDDL